MISRRAFIGTLTGGLLAAPLAAGAQPATKMARVGLLSVASRFAPDSQRYVDVFRQALRELGWVEWQNIDIEWRSAEGHLERLPDLAAELVKLRVDVIVTSSGQAIQQIQQVTKTIPIVAVAAGDLVASGLVASLAKPGGNVTGLQVMGPELSGKQLQLLKEAVPNLSRVGVLSPAPLSTFADNLRQIEIVARALGVQLHVLEVRSPDEFSSAFSALSREHTGALIVIENTFMWFHRSQITNLARKNRLPTIHQGRVFVHAGGLMSYGVSLADLFRRAAGYVDKILKGAKPADLPVEQPTKFELVINLKTAKALGLTIPPSLLVGRMR